MIELIIGICVGYWMGVHNDKVKEYWNNIKVWFKENCVEKEV